MQSPPLVMTQVLGASDNEVASIISHNNNSQEHVASIMNEALNGVTKAAISIMNCFRSLIQWFGDLVNTHLVK